MSIADIDQAHAHAVTVAHNVIQHATSHGHTELVAALTATAAACEAGIPAAKGTSMAAQGDATAAIFHTLDAVIAAAVAITDKKDPVHADIGNFYNSIEHVADAVHKTNKERYHAAIA